MMSIEYDDNLPVSEINFSEQVNYPKNAWMVSLNRLDQFSLKANL